MHIGYYKFPRMILLFASLFGGGIILSAMILGLNTYTTMVSCVSTSRLRCHRAEESLLVNAGLRMDYINSMM